MDEGYEACEDKARQKKQVCEAFKNIPISGQSPLHMVKYL